jgi:hypothetical protein
LTKGRSLGPKDDKLAEVGAQPFTLTGIVPANNPIDSR